MLNNIIFKSKCWHHLPKWLCTSFTVFNTYCKLNSLVHLYFSSTLPVSQLRNKTVPYFFSPLSTYLLFFLKSNNSDLISHLLDMFPTVIFLFLSFVLAFQGYCSFLSVGPSVLSLKVIILHYCCCLCYQIKCDPDHVTVFLKAPSYSLLLQAKFFNPWQ